MSSSLFSITLTAGLAGLTGCSTMLGNLTGHHTYADAPPASAFAASQAGKLVFSTRDIPHDLASGDALATSFTLDQPLWWRPFLVHSPYNSILAAGEKCGQANHDYILSVRRTDGPPDAWQNVLSDPNGIADRKFVSWTTSGGDPLLGKGAKEERPGRLATNLLAYLLQFPRGTIPLEFRYGTTCDGPADKDGQHKTIKQVELARGTLNITVTGPSVAAYVQNNGIMMESVAFAHADDAKRIEAEAREAVSGKQVVAFFMRQRDWTIERGDLEQVLRRHADGTIVVRNGETCGGYDFRAFEDHMGGGKFVATPVVRDPTFSGNISLSVIPCEAIPHTRDAPTSAPRRS